MFLLYYNFSSQSYPQMSYLLLVMTRLQGKSALFMEVVRFCILLLQKSLHFHPVAYFEADAILSSVNEFLMRGGGGITFLFYASLTNFV